MGALPYQAETHLVVLDNGVHDLQPEIGQRSPQALDSSLEPGQVGSGETPLVLVEVRCEEVIEGCQAAPVEALLDHLAEEFDVAFLFCSTGCSGHARDSTRTKALGRARHTPALWPRRRRRHQ